MNIGAPFFWIGHAGGPGTTERQKDFPWLSYLRTTLALKEAPAAPLRASRRSSAKRKWPDYARVPEGPPLAHNSAQRDVSRSGFHLVQGGRGLGFGVKEVAARLMEEGGKARENGEQYALTTAQRAAGAAQRRERKR